VFAETLQRCGAAGLDVFTLPTWYDVDDAATLEVLAGELLEGRPPGFATMPGYAAPHTRAFLETLLAVRTA
jgi:DNA-binding transcriptional LysR family regulator